MTIENLRAKVTELEKEIAAPLDTASKNYFALKVNPRDKNWLAAWHDLAFWTDTRNGLRQASDALLALSLIEKGGDWS